MENSKNQAVQVSNSYWIKVVAIFRRLDFNVRNTNYFNPVMGSLENNLV